MFPFLISKSVSYDISRLVDLFLSEYEIKWQLIIFDNLRKHQFIWHTFTLLFFISAYVCIPHTYNAASCNCKTRFYVFVICFLFSCIYKIDGQTLGSNRNNEGTWHCWYLYCKSLPVVKYEQWELESGYARTMFHWQNVINWTWFNVSVIRWLRVN